MRMFKGQTSQIWRERLTATGWPEPQATAMANFLVGLGELPRWTNIIPTVKRYDIISAGQGVEEWPDGEFVKYEDLIGGAA